MTSEIRIVGMEEKTFVSQVVLMSRSGLKISDLSNFIQRKDSIITFKKNCLTINKKIKNMPHTGRKFWQNTNLIKGYYSEFTKNSYSLIIRQATFKSGQKVCIDNLYSSFS